MIRRLLVLATLMLLTTPAAAQYAISGGSVGGHSTRLPNIIIIDIDDIGLEAFPQLGSPLAAVAGSQVFEFSDLTYIHGNSYPFRTADSFPNLNRLLALGVNFQGMWGSGECVLGRQTLRTGNHVSPPNDMSDPDWAQAEADRAPKRQIQDATGEAYKIYHYGKDVMGCARGTGAENDSCMSGTNGPTANRRTGTRSNGPGFWYASEFNIFGGNTDNGDEGTQSAQVYTVLPDAELYTVSGKPMKNQDEFGVEQALAYIESFYQMESPSTSSQSWWDQTAGQPLFVTLGLHYNHLGSGNACFDTAYTKLRPTAGSLNTANYMADPAPTSPVWKLYDTPTYGLDARTLEANLTHKDYWASSLDCQFQQLEWVDTQLGVILDWLGDEGLKNTILIFMGDNGTIGENLGNRTTLRPPYTDPMAWETGASVSDPRRYGSYTLDANASGLNPCPGTSGNVGTMCGKGTNSETGLNVPFVVAGGLIPVWKRGTNEKARLQFADISETLVQLVAPGRVTGYDGRDFSALIRGGVQPDLGPTTTAPYGGSTLGKRPIAAVLQPNEFGEIWRVWRNYSPKGDHCDYLQNLGLGPNSAPPTPISVAWNWHKGTAETEGDPPRWNRAQAAQAELDTYIRNHPDLLEWHGGDPTLLMEGRGNVTCPDPLPVQE